MKLPNSFKRFLNETVNLNEARVERAKQGFQAVSSFLKNSARFADKFVSTSPQGSFRQKTVIKPIIEETEFDLDILFEIEDQEDWEPKSYHDQLLAAFKGSDRYKDIVDRRNKNRCVTLDYADKDFNVDVVPCIERGGAKWIMNRTTNEFEQTDGDGYARWFAVCNDQLGQDTLISVVRLLKYVRSIHDLDVKSIVLTTLAGRVIRADDKPEYFADIATALVTISERISSEWIEGRSTAPVVSNPVLASETFNRHWDDDRFKKFQAKFVPLVEKMRLALDEPGEEKAFDLWTEVFGDDFPTVDGQTEGAAPAAGTTPAVGNANHARPITDIAKSEDLQYKVRISAGLYHQTNRKFFRGIATGVTNVPSGIKVRFKAETNCPQPHTIKWQVVNTGAHAASVSGGLRGGFLDGHSYNLQSRNSDQRFNWESTEYTGTHWVQCFVIREEKVVAKSAPFYIGIKNPKW